MGKAGDRWRQPRGAEGSGTPDQHPQAPFPCCGKGQGVPSREGMPGVLQLWGQELLELKHRSSPR